MFPYFWPIDSNNLLSLVFNGNEILVYMDKPWIFMRISWIYSSPKSNYPWPYWGFPGKESACSAEDLGLIPGLGRFPWRRKWQPTPVFLPGESHGQRSLVGYSPFSSVQSLSHVRLFATPWAVAHQTPPSMGFSRQEYWSGLPFPSPGDLPNLGVKSLSPARLSCIACITTEPPGKPKSNFLTWIQ